jgi:hypothetical protein
MAVVVAVVAYRLANGADPKPGLEVLLAVHASVGAIAAGVFGYYFGSKKD